MSTVLFGSVEYYEREISAHFSDNGIRGAIMGDAATRIISLLEQEIENAFLYDENMRVQCLHNLLVAFANLTEVAST
ncbi:hypothetical protein [Bacillus sp. T33-2]|uniref:hypothetical protein n=1 Tax=Bacillus sp. T33-2 TaxID=2054168 RepID=UPI000C768311|nr:hypothetical protein [Bacillus sp. T33-2]PLR91616.1 hypothetical protein CVD19_21795 [Bacillus sp. T33-2]